LARALGIPYLSKDLLKETLLDTLGWSDRDWSRQLGGASIALQLRSAEALLEVGQSIALESVPHSHRQVRPLGFQPIACRSSPGEYLRLIHGYYAQKDDIVRAISEL
jgi:hypothetical protein